MGFTFKESSYGPFSKEVDQAIMALSNANYMTEKQSGRMTETIVSSSFRFPYEDFSEQEMTAANQAVDLLSRIKNTDHAEMIATVMFSYDELKAKNNSEPKDVEVFNHVLNWKKRWKECKEEDIKSMIYNLSALGWMSPVFSGELAFAEDLF